MVQRVRVKKEISIDTLPFPQGGVQITRDLLNRVIETRFNYKSIVVYYTVAWEGETNFIDTYTQTIEDRTV